MTLGKKYLYFAILALSCAVVAGAQDSDNSRYFSEMRWRSIGPFRAGRTIAVTGVKGSPHIYYAGAAVGGVWKSSDDGHTWGPIFDGQPVGSIGAVAVSPSNPNVIYVGTGEGLQRKDVSFGNGIYKSTDGGKTWKSIGLNDSQQIGTILIDPKDPDRVYVAVLGHPFGANTERGVFRSTNGGKTWDKVLYKDENTGAIALAFDPNNPNTIYADLWGWRLGPWPVSQNCFGDQACGLYKSADGGTTWNLVPGLPTSADHVGRIGIAVAPANSKRLYALVDARERSGLYKSNDAGATWEVVNSEKRICGRGWDFATIAVDPQNEDLIWVGNQSISRSNDGGHAFTVIKGSADGDDYHTIWINPDNGQNIVAGADQGVTISVNGGETWSPWYNQPTGQFHHVVTDNRFPYWVYGSQQESGTAGVASRSDYGEITDADWHPVGGAEIGYIAPDPLDSNIVYSDGMSKFDHRTGQFQEVGPLRLSGRFAAGPLVFSPVAPQVVYFGTDVVMKSADHGQHWEVISLDLSPEHPSPPPNLGVFSAVDPSHGNRRGAVNTISPSPQDGGVIWAGTDDGAIQVTDDGGKSWKNVTPPELTGWSAVSLIDASHFDRRTAYASVDRHRLDDFHPYIYRTHDQGASWQLIAKGLPDAGWVYEVREDPVRRGLLFACTERGVYVSFNDGGFWQSLQLNLPPTSVRGLAIHGDDLVAATFGRAFWILDDITPLRQITPRMESSHSFLFAPESAYRLRRQGRDNPRPPEMPAGKNPPDGAILDYFIGGDGSKPVTLEVWDHAGNLVRRYSSADKPESVDPKSLSFAAYWMRPPQPLSGDAGMHRFVWDLRYTPPEISDHDFSRTEIPRDTPVVSHGPFVLPGEYTVKLTVGAASQTQSLIVKMDPRVETSKVALQLQFEILQQMCHAINESSTALRQIKSLTDQLAPLQDRAKAVGLGDAVEPIVEQLPKSAGAFRQVTSFLGNLFDFADSADAPPTEESQVTIRKVLDQMFAKSYKEWKQLLDGKLPAVNMQLKQATLPELKLEQP